MEIHTRAQPRRRPRNAAGPADGPGPADERHQRAPGDPAELPEPHVDADGGPAGNDEPARGRRLCGQLLRRRGVLRDGRGGKHRGGAGGRHGRRAGSWRGRGGGVGGGGRGPRARGNGRPAGVEFAGPATGMRGRCRAPDGRGRPFHRAAPERYTQSSAAVNGGRLNMCMHVRACAHVLGCVRPVCMYILLRASRAVVARCGTGPPRPCAAQAVYSGNGAALHRRR